MTAREWREAVFGPQGEAAPAEAPKPAQPGDRCRESGRTWDSFTSPNQCPECGRWLRRTRAGLTPEHKIPRYLRA